MTPAPQQQKKPWIPDYTIKHAKIRWRNFGGKVEKFNLNGERYFTIFLEPHDAEALASMGLNVKTLPIKEEGQEPQDILKVKVNFKGRPPRLVLVTSRGRTTLGEDEANALDLAQIKRDKDNNELVDLILSPYWWEMNGKEGVAVSVKTLFMTIEEDELEMMYSDIPEASSALSNRDYTPAEEPF